MTHDNAHACGEEDAAEGQPLRGAAACVLYLGIELGCCILLVDQQGQRPFISGSAAVAMLAITLIIL